MDEVITEIEAGYSCDQTTGKAFKGFPKIARFSRECIITEKIDGTNAQIYIEQDGTFLVGSRTRWITPQDDNYGFAAWAYAHKEELISGLGPGQHFGEWWGAGIQRKYGLAEKRFSLFNVSRWIDFHQLDRPTELPPSQQISPDCCYVVPILARGILEVNESLVDDALYELERGGSKAAPGFMKPEGIVIFHIGANICFKKTIEKDSEPKGL